MADSVIIINWIHNTINQDSTSDPFHCTRFSSFNAGPSGFLSPDSHWRHVLCVAWVELKTIGKKPAFP